MTATSSPGLQIIGAGLPRTATTSLQAALEQLGYAPCHHMTETARNAYGLGDLWAKALQTKDKPTRQALLRRALAPYRAAVDVPCCLFVEDLIEMYPNARVCDYCTQVTPTISTNPFMWVIHSVRKTPDVWLKSYIESIGILQKYQLYWLFILHPQGRRYRTFYINWQEWNKRHFGVPISSIETYTRHNREMRHLVPQERMIEFQPSSGWRPICEFLACDVPATPFPRLNDKNALRAVLWKMASLGIVLWSALLLFVFVLWKVIFGQPGR